MSRSDLPKSSRTADRVAFALVGTMLAALLLFFERLLAGSWRELAAILLAIAALYAVGVLLERRLRYRGAALQDLAPAWHPPIGALLGAVAGAVYVLVARGYLDALPITTCAGVGAVLGVFGAASKIRRAGSTKPRVPPAA